MDLKKMIDSKNPSSSDVKSVLEGVFNNKNNFIYITEDKKPSLSDSTGKKGHEFIKYLIRAEPLVRLIGKKDYNWRDFSIDADTVKLFSDEVNVHRIQDLEHFRELLERSQKLVEDAKFSRQSLTKNR